MVVVGRTCSLFLAMLLSQRGESGREQGRDFSRV